MSKLKQKNCDDYPDAALKHLSDAAALLDSNRPDGAAYLSGYVVECGLKSIYQLETKQALISHDWQTIHQQVINITAVAGAKTAKYLGLVTRQILSKEVALWRPAMRYHSPSMTPEDAKLWQQAAEDVYNETIGQMYLDGVL